MQQIFSKQIFSIHIQQIFFHSVLVSLEQKSNVLMHVFLCLVQCFFKGDEIDRGVNYRDSNVQMNGPFFGIKETGFQM